MSPFDRDFISVFVSLIMGEKRAMKIDLYLFVYLFFCSFAAYFVLFRANSSNYNSGYVCIQESNKISIS